MTRRHMIMAAALVIAAWLALFGDNTPNTGISEPTVRTNTGARTSGTSGAANNPTASNASGDKAKHSSFILPLQNREQLMGGAHAANASGALFNSQSWTPPPPPPPPAPPPPMAAPSAPPLPFVFLGKKVEDGKWEVYLARGDQPYVARVKTIIEGTYRIDSITSTVLSMTYLPLQQVQTINIGGID